VLNAGLVFLPAPGDEAKGPVIRTAPPGTVPAHTRPRTRPGAQTPSGTVVSSQPCSTAAAGRLLDAQHLLHPTPRPAAVTLKAPPRRTSRSGATRLASPALDLPSRTADLACQGIAELSPWVTKRQCPGTWPEL